MSEQNKDLEISQDDIKKALDILGISSDIEKAEKDKEETEEKEEEDESKEENKSQSKEKEESEEDDDDEVEKAYKKAGDELAELEKACSMKKSEMEEMDKKRKKSPVDPIQKSESDNLIKGLQTSFNSKMDETISAISTLYKASQKENDELRKSLSESNQTLGKLNELVTIMANQSMGRKSFLTAKAIEKSQGNDLGGTEGKEVISKSRDRAKLDQILLDLSNVEKGEINMFYADAATLYNTSGTLTKAQESDLLKSHNIQIVE